MKTKHKAIQAKGLVTRIENACFSIITLDTAEWGPYNCAG
jgi:hypothetical protein